MSGGKTKKKRAPTRGGKTKKKRAPTKTVKDPAPAPPRAESSPFRLVVSVFETTRAAGERAREVLAELGCTVTPETTAAEVARRCAGSVPPDAVLAAFPGADAIAGAVRDRGSARPPLIASLAGPASTARERAELAGADLFVIRPHGVESVASALCAASALAAERARAASLASSEAMLRERLMRYGQADVETGFQHFDFFKTLLVRELKRAKRYGYPLAAVVVALDPWADGEPPREVVRALRVRVASAITACIRDIDLPVDLEQDRFLVFLPYTDLDGAENVGKRVAQGVKAFAGELQHDHGFALSVSVGIAATRPGKPISFARMMRDASAAVRASQLKGGGRVVVRR